MRNLYLLLLLCFGFGATCYAQPSYNMANQTVTDTAGFLFDAGGPSANYFDDDTLTFTINVGPGKTLNLQWLFFDVETNEAYLSTLCIYDYVEVFDSVPGVITGARYCGTTRPPNFTVESGIITIRFISDGAGNNPGFQAYWTTGDFITPPPPNYCEAYGGTCGGTNAFIAAVDVDGKTYTNNDCQSNAIGRAYSDYTDSVFTMEANVPSTVTITNANTFPLTAHETIDIYIDWNNDGTFNAVEEKYPGVPGGTATTVIPAPNATTGFKRMRIRTWDAVFQAPDGPLGTVPVIEDCGASQYGEVEDYTVYYTNPDRPLPLCATGFTPANNANNVCINTIVRWNSVVDATSYQFSLSEVGGATLVDRSIITDTSFNVSTLIAPGKTYKYFVLPTGDNGEALACDTITFTTSANPDPTVGITPAADTLQACLNTPFTLSGNPVSGTNPYASKWRGTGKPYLNDTTIESPNFTGTLIGTYTLSYTVTDANGCMASDTVRVQVITDVNGGTISAIGSDTVCENTPLRFKVLGSAGNINLQDSLVGGVWNDMPTTKINDTIYEVVENQIGKVFFRTFASGTNCSDVGTSIDSLVVNPSPIIPTVALVGSDTICDGQSVRLVVTNYSANIVWNDAAATANDTLIVTVSGDYTATYTGATCPATSAVNTIAVGPIPTASIDFFGSLTACANELPLLFTSLGAGETNVWSNGATTKDIQPAVSGKYFVKITNAFGCTMNSDTLDVIINGLPAKPSISVFGSANPCEGEPVELRSSYISGNIWNTTDTTRSIIIKRSGSFAVSYTDANGCTATSDTLSQAFRPAPVKPTVQVTGKVNTCIGDSVKLAVTTPVTPDWNDANNTVASSIIVYTNGDYFAHYVNADGCEVYSDTVAVTFTQFQETPTIRLSGSLCEGNQVALISSIATGNTWDDANQTKNDTLFVTMDGNYSLVNIQNGVCVAYAGPYTVSFIPAPAQPVINEVGDSLVSSVIGFSYQWISDKGLVPNSNSRSIKPKFTSNYRVVVYTEEGCVSPASNKYYKGFTGIQELAAAGITVYPNPFTTSFRVSVTEEGEHSFSVVNQLGQVVAQGELEKGSTTISIDVASGVYQLLISTPNGIISDRLVKK